MTDRDRLPVIVGVSQFLNRDMPPDQAAGPVTLMANALKSAAADAGAPKLLARIDDLIAFSLFADGASNFPAPFGSPDNMPQAVAEKLSIAPSRLYYSLLSGEVPQRAMAQVCRSIARGEIRAAALVGAEALRTQRNAQFAGLELDWRVPSDDAPLPFGGQNFPARSPAENRHGVQTAADAFALVEQAIRADRGTSPDQHLARIAALWERFSQVAAQNPFADRNTPFTADEIGTVTPKNPYISLPYTRRMSSHIFVDQSAAVIVCSAALADELGVAEGKRVYLHAHAEANDHIFVSQREYMHRSNSIAGVWRRCQAMTGLTLDQIDTFDLYSAFSSCVELALTEMGLPDDDPRNFTVTGGMPFFGGPGCNYVTHAIAETVTRLRTKPDSYGLIMGNGHIAGCHAMGIYSTKPIKGPWQQDASAGLQAEIDAIPKARMTEEPQGNAVIETYAVPFAKDGPTACAVIGRMTETGARFVARTGTEPETLTQMVETDPIGRSGSVTTLDGISTFRF